MTRFAQLIAKREGFGLPGTLPTRRNNPGDLRHGPHEEHPGGDPNAIGTVDTVAHGWEDLERQLALYASRGLTIAEAVAAYAPVKDANDTDGYLAFICAGLGLPPETLVSEALAVMA